MQWVILHTNYRTTHLGEKTLCFAALFLMKTFMFDRKAEKY